MLGASRIRSKLRNLETSQSRVKLRFQICSTILSLPVEFATMKIKIITLLSLVMSLSFTACHYGEEGAKESVETNNEYKGKRAEKEAATALPDDAAAKMNGTAPAEEAPAADTTAVAE